MATLQTKYEHKNQSAPFRCCDWIIYPTLKKLEEFIIGIDSKGASTAVYFNPEKQHHGFDTYHRAITSEYFYAVKALREAGVTKSQWLEIKSAVFPSPMAKATMARNIK